MADLYVRKPVYYTADQWHEGDDTPLTPTGSALPVTDGDWVVRDTITGEAEVVSDDFFGIYFETSGKKATPKVPAGA